MALWLGGLWCLGPASMSLFLRSTEYPVKRRFRCQIHTIVSQTWHDLRRWQIGEARLVADGEHTLTLLLTQLVCRHWPGRCRPGISADFNPALPALESAHAQAQFGTGQTKMHAILSRLHDIGD
jgi:hypothetical protein